MDTDTAIRATATPPHAPLPDAAPPPVSIRPVASLQEFHACVDLQADVWGPDFTDIVPASLLQVATYVGGITLGAFTTQGELVGFLFGLTGVEKGEIVHWSHLLGVRDSVRNLGVGRQLKEAQRAELAVRGIPRMSWSFDPLVAKNAYLNLNRLGARVVEYVPDMYGTTSSPLHFGLATDRLVVSCDTQPPKRTPETFDSPLGRLAVLTPDPHDGDLRLDKSTPPAAFWIEIPSDVRQVIEHAPDAALPWRESVREHFQWALAHAYEVTGIHREPVGSRSFYILRKADGA